MRCEICGKKIIGKPVKTKIENSVMLTCNECSKFGKVQRELPHQQNRGRGVPRTSSRMKRSYRSQEPSHEIIEGYGKIIREAREKKGWSREELGEKIYEKTSVINRLESGRMMPDLKLARKIERILNVTLLEKTEAVETEDKTSSRIRGATIGDIAKIKKN